MIAKAIGSLESQIEGLQLKRRHSLIDPDSFLSKIKPIAAEFAASMESLSGSQINVTEEDPLLLRLDQLLQGRVGEAISAKGYGALVEEGKKRYDALVPPGYLDASKADSKNPYFQHNGILYDVQFGDLIIWKQIVAHCKSARVASVIFITDDEKEDWWRVVDSGGSYRLGPRPELIEEIYEDAGVRHFMMYSSSTFMTAANTQLKVSVSEESITQVKAISDEARFHGLPSMLAASEALEGWLNRAFPSSLVQYGGFEYDFDFIIKDGENITTAYEMFVFNLDTPLRNLMSNRASRLAQEALSKGISGLVICLMTEDEAAYRMARRYFDSANVQIPAGVRGHVFLIEERPGSDGHQVKSHYEI